MLGIVEYFVRQLEFMYRIFTVFYFGGVGFSASNVIVLVCRGGLAVQREFVNPRCNSDFNIVNTDVTFSKLYDAF